jgi:hypothetical protein
MKETGNFEEERKKIYVRQSPLYGARPKNKHNTEYNPKIYASQNVPENRLSGIFTTGLRNAHLSPHM